MATITLSNNNNFDSFFEQVKEFISQIVASESKASLFVYKQIEVFQIRKSLKRILRTFDDNKEALYKINTEQAAEIHRLVSVLLEKISSSPHKYSLAEQYDKLSEWEATFDMLACEGMSESINNPFNPDDFEAWNGK